MRWVVRQARLKLYGFRLLLPAPCWEAGEVARGREVGRTMPSRSKDRTTRASRKTEEREEAIVPKSDKYPGLYKERLLKKPS